MQQHDFVLTAWDDAGSQRELRSAFRKKWYWVIGSPRSPAVWYSSILSNLRCRYEVRQDATIDTIRTALSRGLSKSEFERLKLLTAISSEDLGKAIRVPQRTLARRQTFKPDESERILRVSSAFQRTIEALGSLDQARRWFVTPKRALGGKTPLEFCDTEPGAEEVIRLLGRIEHGVFT